jgi:hypothetical protein
LIPAQQEWCSITRKGQSHFVGRLVHMASYSLA